MISDGHHRFQARDKRWVELTLDKKQVRIRKGAPGAPAIESARRFTSARTAGQYAQRTAHGLFLKGFRRVSKIVSQGRLQSTAPPKAERRRIRRAQDRALAAAEVGQDAALTRALAQSARRLRPSGRAGDGAAAARALTALAGRLRRLTGTRVRARIGKPANEGSLTRSERALGIRLPPSLRSYLQAQDGVEISWSGPLGAAALDLLSARGMLVERRRLLAAWPTEAPERPLLAALLPLSRFRGDLLLALDTRKASREGELAVVAYCRPFRARDHHLLAPDFATWVKRLVGDGLVVRRIGDVMEQRLPSLRRALTHA